MPDLNDFYVFKSTTSSNGGSGSHGGSSGSGGNGGCAGTLLWVAAILSFLWIIGILFG